MNQVVVPERAEKIASCAIEVGARGATLLLTLHSYAGGRLLQVALGVDEGICVSTLVDIDEDRADDSSDGCCLQLGDSLLIESGAGLPMTLEAWDTHFMMSSQCAHEVADFLVENKIHFVMARANPT